MQTQYQEFLKLSPKQQKKGSPWLGTGYWALEVAALAVLYGWDDSALRSSPHYPADLVDYARGRLAQTESGDS
ncbi:PoNe immunity protein domain-containing protein [Comamonas thiooxydans]|uniref:PoNe immunity protein domain-containing protein n=1 Tax=Comamonas thiooxydans TaxID=363952 RepID=UPI001EE68206|nr:PoNe immunity protein domain-containing protein [Comamonas thiooxydans]